MWIWRISSAKFAQRFDGGFGLGQAGRWNELGRLVTYCATGPALCALEKLAHMNELNVFPDDSLLVRYGVPDDVKIETVELPDLPAGWRDRQEFTQSIGTAWLDTVSACLLMVPSVIVPVPESNDRNLLVNHRHADAARIGVSEIARFELDTRLRS